MRPTTPISLVLLSWSASPAAAQLTVPSALPGDLVSAPAAGEQRHAALAQGAGQALLVYEDHRALLGGTVAYTSTGAQVLQFARLDAGGALLDAQPTTLRRGTNSPRDPRVAWNGANYLVVWDELVRHASQSDRGVYAARVSPAGQVLDDPPLLLADTSYVDEGYPVVSSDGGSWVVAWSGLVGGADAIQGCVIAADGVPGAPRTLLTATSGFYFPVNFELASANGRHLFVSQHMAPGVSNVQIFGQLFDPALNRIGGELQLSTGAAAADPAVAGQGAEFCVAWRSANQYIRATPVSSAGAVAVFGGVDLFGGAPLYAGFQLPAVAWDGAQWTVAFGTSSGQNSALYAARLAGSVLAAGSPFVVSQGAWQITRPACASLPGGVQLVWDDTRNHPNPVAGFASDRTDLVGAALATGGGAGPVETLSQSPPAQLDVQVAGDAVQGYLVAFFSVTQTSTRVAVQRLAPDGQALDPEPRIVHSGARTLTELDLAWSGSNWMLTWEEFSTSGSSVHGLRVGLDGAALDPAPVLLLPGRGAALAAVGGEYLVAATHEPVLHLRYLYTLRVRASDGLVLDAAPVQRTSVGYDDQATAAAFQDRWIVAWAHKVTHDAPSATIRFMTILPTGTATAADLGGAGPVTGNNEPALATDGQQALLTWTNGGDVRARRILYDGTKLDTDTGLVVSDANGQQFAPAASWSGSAYLLAYADYRAHTNVLDIGIGDVWTTRVDAGGGVLDPTGRVVAEEFLTPEGRPDLAGGGGQTLLAYQALSHAAPYGTWRVFTALDLPPPGATTCTNASLGSDHQLACPCGNSGAPDNGCAHSFSAAGAHLDARGTVAGDAVVLTASGMPQTSFTLFLQHTQAADAVFHDGVLCAGGTLTRLRGRSAVLGQASFPDSSFAQDATTTLAQRGGVFPGAGVRRHYAGWFRNASTTFCPPATANVTNGYAIDW